MSVSEYKIPEAVVLSHENLSKEGKVLYVPIYMTFCLDEFMEKDDPKQRFLVCAHYPSRPSSVQQPIPL